MAPGRLLLLDSATLYYRAFHALPTSLVGPDGLPNNAVRGFCDALPALVSAAGASHLACAWDVDWRPAWRVSLWPGYKSNRLQAAAVDGGAAAEELPDDLAPQVDTISALLDSAGLARVGAAGFEADDIIATLAARWPGEVVIVTSDRDLLQCVTDDGRVRLLSMARGLSNLQWFDAAAVQERHGVPAQRYADFATLRGDASDGMPGVPGIGEKTAAALVSRWASLPDLLAAALDPGADLTPRVRRALVEASALIPAWAEVTRARTDVDVRALGPHSASLGTALASPGVADSIEQLTALPRTPGQRWEHAARAAGAERAVAKWRSALVV